MAELKQKQNSSTINLKNLLSACISLANVAGGAVREIHDKKTYKVFEKGKKQGPESHQGGFKDPQTEADLTSQMIIVHSLKRTFKGIKIVAEEGNNQPMEIRKVFIPPNLSLLDEENFPEENILNLKDIVVWIDPLDGTSQFIKEKLECVTILIGVSYKEKPIAGVIAQPFTPAKYLNTFSCYWGLNFGPFKIVKCNLFSEKGEFEDFKAKIPEPENGKLKLVVSSSRSKNGEYKKYIEKCHPSLVLRSSGCGKKVLILLNGEAQVYAFPVKGTKKWDTCAPQALLEASGGVLTEPDGEPLKYSLTNIENENGFIASIGVEHSKYIKL